MCTLCCIGWRERLLQSFSFSWWTWKHRSRTWTLHSRSTVSGGHEHGNTHFAIKNNQVHKGISPSFESDHGSQSNLRFFHHVSSMSKSGILSHKLSAIAFCSDFGIDDWGLYRKRKSGNFQWLRHLDSTSE